jgi:hypothetical protein
MEEDNEIKMEVWRSIGGCPDPARREKMTHNLEKSKELLCFEKLDVLF